MKLTLEQKVDVALLLGGLALLIAIIALTTSPSGGAPITGPDAFYEAQAKELKIKSKTFEQCLASPEIEARINEEASEAAMLGGQGTPFNIIETADGTLIPVPGAYPYEVFADIIDRSMNGTLTADETAVQLDASNLRPFDAERDYFKGPADAEITIYEWSDFECPYCSRVHPELEKVVANYPNVKWVYRNLPLSIHPQAIPAAKAALCIGEEAGNDGFWQFADTLFKDQSVLQ